MRGGELGLSMACGTNGFVLNQRKLEEILPHMTYLRINISAGERERYAEIMGVKEALVRPGLREHPAHGGDQEAATSCR